MPFLTTKSCTLLPHKGNCFVPRSSAEVVRDHSVSKNPCLTPGHNEKFGFVMTSVTFLILVTEELREATEGREDLFGLPAWEDTVFWGGEGTAAPGTEGSSCTNMVDITHRAHLLVTLPTVKSRILQVCLTFWHCHWRLPYARLQLKSCFRATQHKISCLK